MKDLDNHTVLEIINMIECQREDLRAMFQQTRPCEPRDSQWIFKNESVSYGADTALRHLSDYLQEYIEGQVSQVEQ